MAQRKKLIEEILESLYAMKNKMHAKVMRPGLKGPITHSQLLVLFIIEEHRDIGIKEISKMSNVSSSAATQVVDGLVENGYVVRKASSRDRRALHLGLSPMGLARIAAMKRKYMTVVATLFNALSDEELGTYLRLHKKILYNMSDKK